MIVDDANFYRDAVVVAFFLAQVQFQEYHVLFLL